MCALPSQKTRHPASPPDAPAPVMIELGGRVGDARDEVSGVELGRIDQHRDGGA